MNADSAPAIVREAENGSRPNAILCKPLEPIRPVPLTSSPILALFAFVGVGVGIATAEPLVVGYERFHAGKPDAEAGRLLFNELGCANCHAIETGLPPRRGPNLNALLTRVDSGWTREFLRDPALARRGATMPNLRLSADEADAVVHFLGSLTPKNHKPGRASRHVNAERGSELFHRFGCVSCHAPSPDFHPADGKPQAEAFTYPSVAFPDLATKYDLVTLAAFLRDPLKFRPHGRMPRIAMEDVDSVDLAAHLLDYQSSDGTKAKRLKRAKTQAAKAKLGREIVTAKRCAACHDFPKAPKPENVEISGREGCLSGKSGEFPGYALSDAQKAALAAFLADFSRKPATAAMQAERHLEALNCYACHARNGKGGPDLARKAYLTGDPSIGDTGRYPSPLTDVGRKLQTPWLEGVLAGKNRVRPYVHARMPEYGELTNGLAQLFARADEKSSPPLPKGDVKAGQKLVGTQGGLNCIICHRWGERASLGIPALDISNVAERLQPGWWEEYLLDPAGYRPGTLMPPLWPGGTASNREILGGDTRAQIAAIYAFAAEGKELPEGYPEIATGAFELVPVDRPIVQRTFMHEVGSRAIVVGFPEGVHLAYDAGKCRPALMWKGRFFDAYGTWFVRQAPFADPLGDAAVKWPDESRFAAQFRGYRLDEAGIPTFLFEAAGGLVEETFVPVEGGFQRSLSWDESDISAELIVHPQGVKRAVVNSEPGHLTLRYTW